MKDRPIIFSAAIIRAILDGRKTQTRRVVTTREPLQFIGGKGEENDPDMVGWWFDGPAHHGYMVLGRGHNERFNHGSISIPCPYGEPGDRLWCKETWRTAKCFDDRPPRKIAEMALEAGYERCWAPVALKGGHEDGGIRDFGGEWGRWRSSIHMPRWASRITLEVTDVRVQRLKEISEDDARAEGVEPGDAGDADLGGTARGAFCRLWDSIYGKRCPWSSNPWIWALTFRRLP